MFLKKKKAPLKKRFLAKYVSWLEVIGFIFIGILISTMIGSAIYEIDDVMKFSSVAAEFRSDSMKVLMQSYVNEVFVEEGARVELGSELLKVTGSAESADLIKTIDSIQKALESLEPDSADGEVKKSLEQAMNRSLSILEQESSHSVSAPISGIVKGKGISWKDLSGKVVNGEIGTVVTYDSLRFAVPVGGDNAPRVRINLLAEQDVADWKLLTNKIKSREPPSDPVVKNIWDSLKGKLEEVKPGKRPLKRLMPEIVGVLNEILRKRDFYDPDLWKDKNLSPEAQELAAKGTENLSEDELIRLNRLLLNTSLPKALEDSKNEYQVVKAKLYIPVEEKGSDGKTIKGKPKIFPIHGKVVHEPSGGRVVIDLPNPPEEIVEYLKRRSEDSALPTVTCSGSIVVGRISLFRFLFK